MLSGCFVAKTVIDGKTVSETSSEAEEVLTVNEKQVHKTIPSDLRNFLFNVSRGTIHLFNSESSRLISLDLTAQK